MSPATATLPTGEIRVPLEQLRPSPLNPRKSFDPKKLEELTASVRTDGILQALLVRPKGTGYEIVYGERRYRAAKAAGLTEIPVKVQDLTDAEVLHKQVVENDQREDVHPLDQAEGYRRLLKATGVDVDELGKQIGKSRSYIYQRLKLGELNETGQQAFRAGELTASHAILLARLQPKDQAAALKATIREEGIDDRDGHDAGPRVKAARSVRALEAWIATNVHLDLGKAPFPTDDPKLLPSAGACGPCPKRAANLAHLEPELAAKRPDTCTDHSCYDAKVARWLEARMADATAKTRAAGGPGAGRKVVRLSDEYSAETPNALGTKDWQRAATGDCPARALGVIVEASTRGYGDVRVKLGEILPVCLAKDKRCKVHNLAAARERPATSYGADQRRRMARAKTASEERWRILAAVQDTLKGPLPRKALDLVAIGFWDEVWHETRVRVARAMNWKAANLTRVAAGEVPKLTDVGLAKLLLALAVAKDLHVPSYGGGGGPQRLLAAARLFKVNPRRIKPIADKPPAARRRPQVPARSRRGDTWARRSAAAAAAMAKRLGPERSSKGSKASTARRVAARRKPAPKKAAPPTKPAKRKGRRTA